MPVSAEHGKRWRKVIFFLRHLLPCLPSAAVHLCSKPASASAEACRSGHEAERQEGSRSWQGSAEKSKLISLIGTQAREERATVGAYLPVSLSLSVSGKAQAKANNG